MNKLATLCSAAALAAVPFCGASEISGQTRVWAHNTPWFRPEDYSLFTTWFYNYPLMETADSKDIRYKSLREECQQAMDAGIDGMFLDFGTDPNLGPMHWNFILPDYLKAVEGTNFQIGICLDGSFKTVDYEVSELTRILGQNASHPNYPHYNGRPVLFTYCYYWGGFKPEDWKAIKEKLKANGFDIFLVANLYPMPMETIKPEVLDSYLDAYDGIYMFDAPTANSEKTDVQNKFMAEYCAKHGKVFFPTLYPGYLTEWMDGNDFYGPHRGNDVLFMTLKAAKNLPGVKQYNVTTWNDLFETAVLPRAYSFGRLDALRYCCKDLKNEYNLLNEPNILFGWHREELAGTLLRIEAASLPVTGTDPVTVEGTLEDLDGDVVAELPERVLKPGELSRTDWLIATAPLAETPVLVPRFTIKQADYCKEVTAPAIMLVSGWLHNPVTVDVSSQRLMADFPNKLKVKKVDSTRIKAVAKFKSPKTIRRMTLLRNDRPIALFNSELKEEEAVLSFMLSDDTSIEVKNGRILRALKKGANFNGSSTFQWNDKTLMTKVGSGGNAVTVAGTADLTLVVTSLKTNKSGEVKASELVQKRVIAGDGWNVRLTSEATLVCDKPVPLPNGELELNVWLPDGRPEDYFYVRYDTTDGESLLAAPVFPFADGNPVKETAVLETPVNLETSSGATGMSFRDEPEFITPMSESPVKENKVVTVKVSELGARHALWHFDGNAIDWASFHGPTGFNLPAGIYADGGFDGTGKCLAFTGNEQLLLRKRAWPFGGAGHIKFYLNPDSFNGKKQSVIYKNGWQDGLCFNLLEDGRVEIVRVVSVDGTNVPKEERCMSTQPLTAGKWNCIETRGDADTVKLYIDGKESAILKVTPARSYGDETIFLGGGFPGYEKYRGKLDELSLDGL